MSRFLATAALAGVLAIALAGCTGPSTDSADGCEATPQGANSAKIKVTGELGKAPTVKFPTPLTTKDTERSVIIDGDGKVAEPGGVAAVHYTVYNATTGKQVDATEYTKDGAIEFPLDDTKLLPGIVKAVECASAGTRLAAVIPPEDAFRDAGSSEFGIGAKDSLVFVIDVTKVSAPKKTEPPLPKADGQEQPAPEGFPSVEVAKDGTPTVTIPDSAPPAELKVAVLKKGDGAVVPKASDVVLHYVGINWNTKKIFDSSWPKGEPATFNTSQVITGFGSAVEGQTVGSQVIVVIPPAEGYGPEGNGPDISGTDTLVFVIDILGLG